MCPNTTHHYKHSACTDQWLLMQTHRGSRARGSSIMNFSWINQTAVLSVRFAASAAEIKMFESTTRPKTGAGKRFKAEQRGNSNLNTNRIVWLPLCLHHHAPLSVPCHPQSQAPRASGHCRGVVSCTARKHTQKHTQTHTHTHTHTRTPQGQASLPLDDVMLLKYTRPEKEADQAFEIWVWEVTQSFPFCPEH